MMNGGFDVLKRASSFEHSVSGSVVLPDFIKSTEAKHSSLNKNRIVEIPLAVIG